MVGRAPQGALAALLAPTALALPAVTFAEPKERAKAALWRAAARAAGLPLGGGLPQYADWR